MIAGGSQQQVVSGRPGEPQHTGEAGLCVHLAAVLKTFIVTNTVTELSQNYVLPEWHIVKSAENEVPEPGQNAEPLSVQARKALWWWGVQHSKVG